MSHFNKYYISLSVKLLICSSNLLDDPGIFDTDVEVLWRLDICSFAAK